MAQIADISRGTTALSDPIERVRALQPLIALHADEADAQGCIAAPVFDALKAAGLFRLTVAKRSGGEGGSMRSFVETVA